MYLLMLSCWKWNRNYCYLIGEDNVHLLGRLGEWGSEGKRKSLRIRTVQMPNHRIPGQGRMLDVIYIRLYWIEQSLQPLLDVVL